jgi:hypothetical protein
MCTSVLAAKDGDTGCQEKIPKNNESNQKNGNKRFVCVSVQLRLRIFSVLFSMDKYVSL